MIQPTHRWRLRTPIPAPRERRPIAAPPTAVRTEPAKYLPIARPPLVWIVGCGGTGSILAEHLARLIVGYNLTTRLVLQDGDRVEAANIARQNFEPHEIGHNKAQALALRLAGRFGLAVESRQWPVTPDDAMLRNDGSALLIGCVDNHAARKILARGAWRAWLDVANELAHGQAVLGTTQDREHLAREYDRWDADPVARHVPTLAAIVPAIAAARPTRSPRQTQRAADTGCATAPFAAQGFGVNAMAALAAATIAKQILVDQRVTTPQIWFDLAAGRWAAQPITRALFARWSYKKHRGTAVRNEPTLS